MTPASSAAHRSRAGSIARGREPHADTSTAQEGFARTGLLIVGIAFSLRLVHLLSMRRSPWFDVLLGDARSYDAWAQQIASGDLIGRDVFYQAPLYAYVLGGLYAIRQSLDVVRLCQAVLGSISCALLGLAAHHLFGRAVGLVAGLMLAVYAPAVFFDGLIQKSSLDVFLLCLLLALVTLPLAAPRPTTSKPYVRRFRWLAVGVTLGALSLTRENALLLMPVVLVWLWMRGRSSVATGASTAACLVAGVAVVVFPISLRNWIVGGEFHLTTAQAGPNFFIGNNPNADGTYVPLRVGRGSPEFERADATELATRALGHPLSTGEVSSYWTTSALAYISDHPIDWLALERRKFRLLWNRAEVIDTESQESHEDYSPVLRLLASFAHFGVLAPLACFGAWLTWPERRRLWPLYAMIGTYLLSVMAFYVVARYRLPLVPMLIIPAAAGVIRAGRLLAAASRSVPRISAAAVVGCACLAAVTIFCNVPVVSANTMRAVTYQNLGATLLESGRPADAAAAFQRAVDLAPDYAPARSGLGSALRLQGRSEEAIDQLRRAIDLSPDFDDARTNLANAFADRGQWTEAIARYQEVVTRRPDSVDVQTNLGIALARSNRPEEAARHFRASVALAPDTAKPHVNLGQILLTLGNVGEAVDELSRAVEIDPADAPAHYELGHAYLAGQRFTEAIEQFRLTVALSPSSVEARNNLGVALGSAGRVGEAIEAFRSALQLDPQSRDAQANLQAATALRTKSGR